MANNDTNDETYPKNDKIANKNHPESETIHFKRSFLGCHPLSGNSEVASEGRLIKALCHVVHVCAS